MIPDPPCRRSEDTRYTHGREREEPLHPRRHHARGHESSPPSRSVRSSAYHRRNDPPPSHHRRIEKDKSPGSSGSHRSPIIGSGRLVDPAGSPLPASESNQNRTHSALSLPSRSLKDRLGPSSSKIVKIGNNSRERTLALDRLAEPIPQREESARRPPSFESGHLQEAEFIVDEDDLLDEEEEPPASPQPAPARAPAALRIGPPAKSDTRKKVRSILDSPLSKTMGKRRVVRAPAKKRGAGSPRHGLNLRKPTVSSSVGKARKQLYPSSSRTLPCNKANPESK
ncbi:hypothetical protein Bca4012_063894 [Brassica carinata]